MKNDLNIFYGDAIYEFEDLIRLKCDRLNKGLVCTVFGGGSCKNPSKITSVKVFIRGKYVLNWHVGSLINIRKHQMSADVCEALRRMLGALFETNAIVMERECIRYEQLHWYN